MITQNQTEINSRYSTICQLRAESGFSVTPDAHFILMNCAISGKVHFILSPYHHPIGYIAWADTNKEAVLLFKHTGTLPANAYEYDEGSLSLILDILVLPAWRHYGLRHVLRHLREKRTLVYNKRGDLKARVKHQGGHRLIQVQ